MLHTKNTQEDAIFWQFTKVLFFTILESIRWNCSFEHIELNPSEVSTFSPKKNYKLLELFQFFPSTKVSSG